jgi:DNA-binding NtrC family response regulator
VGKNKKKVLVVDDEEITRNLLNDMLEDEGYDICSVSNAYAALEEIKAHHFDLMITDIVMRDMDGIQLVSAAKKIDSEIRFIVLTAYFTPVTFDQAVDLGAIYCLTKPVDINQLKVLIRRAIQTTGTIKIRE